MTPEEVLGELGDKVVDALLTATEGARQDLSDFREWRPTWIPPMSQRGVANVIHERIWARLVGELEPLLSAGVSLIDREPLREVVVNLESGRTYRLRVKRHSPRDMVSSYPTDGDLAFWAGPVVQTLEGLEEIRLAAGYRWDSEERVMGATVLSYREGKTNPIWVLEVADGGMGGARPIWSRTPSPNLPLIDLERAVRDDEAEGFGQQP